jgi:hypothetical protein
VSWRFVDAHVKRKLTVTGYWRALPRSEQDAIAHRFWEVGRLTLKQWLTPRLESDRITRRPGVHAVAVDAERNGDDVEVVLSDSTGSWSTMSWSLAGTRLI